jgi:hypothetical protein
MLIISPEMKYLIAALYSNWTTHIVDDEGIEQKDIYTAPPKSGRLLVALKPAPWLATPGVNGESGPRT